MATKQKFKAGDEPAFFIDTEAEFAKLRQEEMLALDSCRQF
jgi:hypothetical protein